MSNPPLYIRLKHLNLVAPPFFWPFTFNEFKQRRCSFVFRTPALWILALWWFFSSFSPSLASFFSTFTSLCWQKFAFFVSFQPCFRHDDLFVNKLFKNHIIVITFFSIIDPKQLVNHMTNIIHIITNKIGNRGHNITPNTWPLCNNI